MRIESSVTSISWIPSEAVEGLPKMPFTMGVTHYDDPPPDTIEDLGALVEADAFREANELRGYIEVEDGKIVGHGHLGGGHIGVTRMKLGPKEVSVPAVALETIQPEPEVGDGWIRFTQTVGGRIGLPAPRPVVGRPYFHVGAVSSWTTLELLMREDGASETRLVAASPFPRHSLYAGRQLVEVFGASEFELGDGTPWGDEATPAFAAAVESELERKLATSILRDGVRLVRRRVARGETLVEQGKPGDDLFVLLDGVFDVEVDGEVVAQVGSGAILGERAVVGDGLRTATLRAVRSSRVAVIGSDAISRPHLFEISASRARPPAEA